jgi:hypothetical protein
VATSFSLNIESTPIRLSNAPWLKNGSHAKPQRRKTIKPSIRHSGPPPPAREITRRMHFSSLCPLRLCVKPSGSRTCNRPHAKTQNVQPFFSLFCTTAPAPGITRRMRFSSLRPSRLCVNPSEFPIHLGQNKDLTLSRKDAKRSSTQFVVSRPSPSSWNHLTGAFLFFAPFAALSEPSEFQTCNRAYASRSAASRSIGRPTTFEKLPLTTLTNGSWSCTP